MPSAKVIINLDEPIATINPNIYGHFAEHLGRCIYGGIWVGENSSIPNTRGFRNDIIAALRKIKAPVIRWPGGCFADDYHWQDGIGPRDQRPRRINIHWGEVIETNAVGTHEFVDFCRLVGAEPYFCGNVGSGTPRELRDWVEYCNFPGDSTWAQKRASDGSPEPFNINFWGVGNENWGCGGNFSPEDYCTEYRRFASFLRGFGKKLTLIACGPSGNDVKWTTRFFEKLRHDYWNFENIQAFSAHYYCGTAGNATEYSENEWYRLLGSAAKMEQLVIDQRAALDVYDPQRQIGLIVDEWGTWHPVVKGTNPAFLYQQNSIRDGLVAALSLDIFNRHADKVVMANIAQTINVLQAMVLTEDNGTRMLLTPTYHVYDLYQAHQGGQSLRTHFEADEIAFPIAGKAENLSGLSGSASLKGRTLTLSLVNPHADDAMETEIQLRAGAAHSASVAVLASPDIHAYNTFDAPETVKPLTSSLAATGNRLHLTLAPASVTVLTVQLG
jgi:alpha-L-arabinofuranosidase